MLKEMKTPYLRALWRFQQFIYLISQPSGGFGLAQLFIWKMKGIKFTKDAGWKVKTSFIQLSLFCLEERFKKLRKTFCSNCII